MNVAIGSVDLIHRNQKVFKLENLIVQDDYEYKRDERKEEEKKEKKRKQLQEIIQSCDQEIVEVLESAKV